MKFILQNDREVLWKDSLDVQTVGFKVRKYSNQNWTDVMIHKSRVKLINYSFDVRTVGFERFSDYKV